MKIRKEKGTSHPELADIRVVKWDCFLRIDGRHYRFQRGQLVSRKHPALAKASDCFARAIVTHPWPER